MAKSWSVYKHTNKTNGKCYVGITSQYPENRWKSGNGYKGNRLFYRAIQKYTWDGFNHEILFSDLSESQAKEIEVLLIDEFSSANRKFGYNITHGGDGSLGVRHSDETRKKISMAMTGKYCGECSSNFGRKASKEACQKMSAAKQQRYLGSGNPFYGKHHSSISKEKISITKHQNGMTSERPVRCIDTGISYRSIIDASRMTGCDYSAIRKCCVGEYKQTHGFHWEFVIEQGGDD